MKYLLVVISLALTLSADAQNFIDKHYSSYQDMDEATVIHVAPKSFDIASYLIPDNTDESSKLKDLVGSVTALDLVALEETSNALSEYKRGYSLLEKDYDALMNIRDKESRFGFFIDQEDDIIYEIVGLGTDDGGIFILSITGEMRLDMVAEFINEIQEKGHLDKLTPLKKYDTVMFDAYPNPANTDTDITVEIPESMEGGDLILFDFNGQQVKSVLGLKEGPVSVSTEGLAPGTFVVHLENGGVQLKKRIVIVK